jgi:hypothetical protein
VGSFPTKAVYDRSHGPAPSAAGDGIQQGAVYAAKIASEPSGRSVEVTIEALDPGMRFKATIAPESPAKRGNECVVIFDQAKNPWVVSGNWHAEGTAPPSFYEHTQEAAATEWIVKHNLKLFPAFTAFDGAGKQHLGEVHHVSNEELTITFLTALAGKGYCN